MTTCQPVIRLSLAVLLCTACAPTAPRRGSVAYDTAAPGLLPAAWDTGTVTSAGVRIAIECPNISPVRAEGTQSEARHDSSVAAPLAGAFQQIPEYHDCQRLVMGAQPRNFAPLVSIFAREALGEITEAAFTQPGGVPVGQIYNFSSIPYGPLFIQPRYSCLHLRLRGPGAWEAMLESRAADPTCRELPAAAWEEQGAGLLTVRPSTPSRDPTHYPPVARWDRDPTSGVHYVGIKCLDAWCEIGPDNFTPSASQATGGYTSQVKGWYDEQRLAEVTLSPKTMTPGVRARIVPVPRLDTLTIRHFSCPYPCPESRGWIQVATTWLEEASPYYERRMNFAPGDRGNTIHVRRQVKRTGEERWESRIISANGDTTYHRTLRVDHSATGDTHPVPATARWHWREDDETAWFRCDVGCCETSHERISSITAPW